MSQNLALQGKLILDCSQLLPGPFVGKLLADQGARVIKIENPNKPDPARSMGIFHRVLNAKKEILWLDITSPTDRPEFENWVRKAHGLIEGYRPAAKKRFGLDPETLHQVNPLLCISSIIGWDSDSGRGQKAGHDLNFQASTGLLSLSNEMPPLPWADLLGAWQAALNMASALVIQADQGRGVALSASMARVLDEAQELLKQQYREDGKLPLHGSNLFSGLFPCYRIYRAQCGRRIAVGAIEEKFWIKVCNLLEVLDCIPHRMAVGEQGKRTCEQIQSAFLKRSWAEWASAFEEADCCVEPILDYSEIP